MNAQTKHLLDEQFPTLNAHQKIEFLVSLLEELLDSSALSEEYKDCLELSYDYDWEPKTNSDLTRFNDLKLKSNEGCLEKTELNEFMSLCSFAGEGHIYHAMKIAQDAVESYRNVQETMNNLLSKPFSVIGYYEETEQIFCHHVWAVNSSTAFYEVAQEHTGSQLIAVVDGHISENQGIRFASQSVVDGDTVLEQPEVFDLSNTDQGYYPIIGSFNAAPTIKPELDKVYSLIYLQRPFDDLSDIDPCGPFISTSREELVDKLALYCQGDSGEYREGILESVQHQVDFSFYPDIPSWETMGSLGDKGYKFMLDWCFENFRMADKELLCKAYFEHKKPDAHAFYRIAELNLLNEPEEINLTYTYYDTDGQKQTATINKLAADFDKAVAELVADYDTVDGPILLSVDVPNDTDIHTSLIQRNETDFVLSPFNGSFCWIRVGSASLRIMQEENGVSVKVYPSHEEDGFEETSVFSHFEDLVANVTF